MKMVPKKELTLTIYNLVSQSALFLGLILLKLTTNTV